MQLPKHLKIAAGSGGAAVFGILFGWVIFPTVLKSQLKKEMSLSPKTDVRQMWVKVPFGIDFKVYLFNYTNVDEIQKGAIPIVKEVGPYYFDLTVHLMVGGYRRLLTQARAGVASGLPFLVGLIINPYKESEREWKEKVEVKDQEENDTITFKRKDTFYFKPHLSGPGLTGEEEITFPNVFMLAMATIVSRDKPAMLSMIGKALNGIFDNPENAFIKVKALDILFRGIIINCARTEFAPKAVCTALKKEATGLVFEPNNQYRFSLFGMRNATPDTHVITVKRGMKNVKEVGSIIAIDGKDKQDVWRDHCNNYEGTDGTIFPPFLYEDERLKSFSPDLCRSFKPNFQKKTSYAGIKTNRYVTNIGDLANDPELQCFCDTPDTCPKKGLMDLTKCINAPMYVSMPHFLDCDPEILRNIKGVNPDINEHGILIDFEPMTGTPLEARQRIQFNLQLLKTDKIDILKDMPDTIAPLFWVEEGLALNNDFIKMLKHQLFLPKRIVGVMRWLLVSFGSLGVIGSLVFHFKGNIMKFAVTQGSAVRKVKPEEVEQVSVVAQAQPEEPAKVQM